MRRIDAKLMREVVAGDLTSDAVRVWMFLRYCVPAGCGKANLRKAFKDTDVDADLGVEILEELDMVVLDSAGKIKAVDPARADQKSNAAMVDYLIERYQDKRRDRHTGDVVVTDAIRSKFAELAVWINSQSIKPDVWIGFVFDVYDGIDVVKVVTPGHVCGKYVREQWANRRDHAANAAATERAQAGSGKHAGKEYRPTKAIARELRNLGVDPDGFSQSDLRYIDDMSSVYEEDVAVPSRFRAAVLAMYRKRHAARP